MSNWKEKILDDLVEVDPEQLTSSTEDDYSFFYIDISSVTPGYINFPIHPIKFKGAPSRARKILRENDILMSSVRPNLKGFAQFKRKSKLNFIASTGFSVLRAKPNTDVEFIYQSLFSNDIEKQIESLVVGSNYPAINSSDVRKLKINTPSITIQRKISKILTTADSVIEKSQAAIAKYTAIKQGMLHDLFTCGIDLQTGKLRPKYEDAPELYKESKMGWIPKEWCSDNFENASEIITDFTANGSFEALRVNVRYYYEPNYGRLIRLTDLRVNLKNDGVYVDKYGFDFLSKSSLRENDIMLANVGEYTGFACLMPKVNYPATIAPNMFLIRCNAQSFNPLYMYYFMTLDAFARQVDNVSGSSATKLLNKTNFRAIAILKPLIKEQELIGIALKAIENKLQSEQNYLHKLKQIKAGLMDDLLNGKKEVKIQEELVTQTPK